MIQYLEQMSYFMINLISWDKRVVPKIGDLYEILFAKLYPTKNGDYSWMIDGVVLGTNRQL